MTNSTIKNFSLLLPLTTWPLFILTIHFGGCEDLRAEQMQVPRTLLIAISPTWRERAAEMPIATKKEFFYRCLLPL